MENGMPGAALQGVPGTKMTEKGHVLNDALGMAIAMMRRTYAGARTHRIGNGEPTADVDRLHAAFSAFEGAAGRLERSYELLRGQVQELSSQLAHAHQELERQLREKHVLAERQGALLAALPAGVLVVDADDRVCEANPAAEKIMGARLLGVSWRHIEERLQPVAGTGEWLTPGDDPRRIGLQESFLADNRGRILLLHDVTETHAVRERMERNERLASMGEMAARLAHQLRTPLATAMLYADRLERNELNEQDRSHLGHRILARLRNLERVTRQMLRFASGERFKQNEISVTALLSEAADVIGPIMAVRGIAFTVEDHTGRAMLQGDRRGLCAALLSLLENAAQATPQGGKVRIEGMANSSRVCIRVNDSGSGIDPRALPRLFEPFFSTRAEGTGLGLAIVKSVIETHGGSIEVHSEMGAGTCFTLILPCSRPRPASSMAQPGASAPSADGPASSASQREAA